MDLSPSYIYVYCWWLWLWSALFLFDFIHFSPLPTLLIAFIVTFTNLTMNTLYKTPFLLKTFIIFIELTVLILVYLKQLTITINDVLINIAVFFIYTINLWYRGTNFYDVYFKILPKKTNVKNTYNYVITNMLKKNKEYFIVFFTIIIIGTYKKYIKNI
jgi:hypothetical protein